MKAKDVCKPDSDEAPKGWVRPIYVVQEHDASRLHWDLRLEKDCVLKSWAVTKEPPVEEGVRRLAVAVEDHALSYASFEGIIPEGNYGAGPVRIWDKGTFTEEEWTESKIVVKIKGQKINGKYVLIKLKDGKNWLFFKGKQ
ncbi:DNA polymerase Ligase (LigD) [uncultured archaeon]|nr:DNA polymerase Ligase (LigD) [uncultured archaeon]